MGLLSKITGGEPDEAALIDAQDRAAQEHEAAREAVAAAATVEALAWAEERERAARVAVRSASGAVLRHRTASIERQRAERETAERELAMEAADLLAAASRHLRSVEVLLGKVQAAETRLAAVVGGNRAHALVGQWSPKHLLSLIPEWRRFHVRLGGPLAGGDGDAA
jgi:hypothetical protein